MIVGMLRTIWREEVLSHKYGKEIAITCLCAAIGFGAYQGYSWHRYKQEKLAQYAMAEAIDELDKAQYYLLDQKEQNVQLAQQYLKDAQLAFDTVHNSHSSSSLVPYSYAFEADIALRQGDNQRALELLDKSLSSMSSKDPLYGMMRIKRALVRIDSADVATGVQELEKIVADIKNPHADTAAFYLGYYYLTEGKKADAVRVWDALRQAMKNVDKKSAQSPWMVMVEEKLHQLGA